MWRTLSLPSPLRVVPHRSHERSAEEATALLAACKARTDGHAPLCTSEKLPADVTALIATYSTPEPPPAQRGRGRPRHTPRRVLEATLLYAQGEKRREQGRVVEVHRRILCGARDISTKVLGGQQIHTAYVERDNLTSRRSIGRLVHQTLSHAKKSSFLGCHLALEDAVFNFVRPHQALRIAVPHPTLGCTWQQRTPAMAVELTDHLWSLEELLSYRVPPPKDSNQFHGSEGQHHA